MLAVGVDFGVGFSYRSGGVIGLYSFTVYKRGVGFLNTLPAVVSVHTVKSAHYRGELSAADFRKPRVKLVNIVGSACGRNVPSVKKGVNINFGKTVLFRHFNKSVKMLDMTVYAAVGKKSHKMKRAAVLLTVVHSVKQCFICKEIAVFYGFCYSGKLLINNSAGANVCVTDFAVAHLTVRKTDVHTRRAYLSVGTFGKYFIKSRGICGIYSVSDSVRIYSETVHYR